MALTTSPERERRALRKTVIVLRAATPALALACVAVWALASAQTPAGSGLIAPYALARDEHDDVFIADPGAQRIFERHGTIVSPVAGSGDPDAASGLVPPGYRDGPAPSARFNRPSGIVVMPDGSLLVADAGNHCLRRIASGTVTTFAGNAARAGNADGPVAGATFEDPVALARDGDTIYVADYGSGIRKISGATVSTLAIARIGTDVRAVGTSGGSLFIATRTSSFTATLVPGTNRTTYVRPFVSPNGERAAGTPSGFYGIDASDVLYADPVARTVRSYYRRTGENSFTIVDPETIPPHALPDDPGGRARGDAIPGTSRTLQRPTAVVMLSNGSLVVADPAAHAVDDFPAPDLRHPVSADISDLELDGRTSYRIAFISNSYAYYNVPYAKSIGATIEDTLAARRQEIALPRAPRVLSIRIAPATSSAEATYIETYLANGNFDLVVWMYDAVLTSEYENANGEVAPGTFERSVRATLEQTSAALRASHTALLVAFLPNCSALSRLECALGLASRSPKGPDAAKRRALDATLRALIPATGVDFVDLQPPFASFEARADRAPLYGTIDGHLSERGDELAGDEIARAIVARKPWIAAELHP